MVIACDMSNKDSKDVISRAMRCGYVDCMISLSEDVYGNDEVIEVR